ncbi:MAG: hypothetical protein C4K58_07050 [Flavobacteriaceae bacterium]|nr:MAG: hypothetical protein C4K58_07050 [Flavobacteriaceae bacterium]
MTLTSQFVFGQQTEKKQVAIATTFLNYVKNGQMEKGWKIFDKENNPNITKEKFENGFTQLNKDLSTFDSFELTMSGVKFDGEKQFNQYTFKCISKTKNIVDDVSIDILFLKSSKLIANVQPKVLVKDVSASTSKGKETSIEKSFVAIIEGVSYNITGINIVHFNENEGLLAIQVEYTFPTNENNMQEFFQKEGVKFARYLVENGYVNIAKLKAEEIDKILLNEIGVSFFDKVIGQGFNVMLNETEFK